MTDETPPVAPTSDEMKVLRAFALRAPRVAVIAEAQGMTEKFVTHTLEYWTQWDQATAKSVVAQYDQPESPPSELPKRTKSPSTKPATVDVKSEPAPTPWVGDVWELLGQAELSDLPSARMQAGKIRGSVQALVEVLRSHEEQVAQDIRTIIDGRLAALKAQAEQLTTEYDRLSKEGVEELAVRNWAAANGVDVPKVGRLSQFVIRAYLTATVVA